MKEKINVTNLYLFLVLFVCVTQSIFGQTKLLFVEIILLIVFLRKIEIQKGFVAVIALLLLHGCINIFLGNDTIDLLLKQIIGITVSYVFYWNFCKSFDVIKIFGVYINVVKGLSIFGIIQQAGYVMHIRFLYDFSWLIPNQQVGTGVGVLYRVDLLFSEPSMVAFFFAPALYIAILSLIYKEKYSVFYSKWSAILVIIMYCMSFSSVAYLGIAISCGLIVLRNRDLIKKAFICVLGIVLIFVLWNNVPGFRERVNDSLELLSVEKIEGGNLSSVVFITNMRVTLESVKDHCGMGTGLGSYVYEHDKYSDQMYKVGVDYGKHLNREDANSLVLRTLTECGIVGLLFLICFVLKYRVVKQNIYTDISHAIIVGFLLRGIRHGHYFAGEFFFFISIYLLCYRDAIQEEGIINNNATINQNKLIM